MGARQSRTLPRSFGRRKRNVKSSNAPGRRRALSAADAMESSSAVSDAVFGASLERLRYGSDPIFSTVDRDETTAPEASTRLAALSSDDEVPEVLIALVRYLCEHDRHEMPFIFRKDGPLDVCRALQDLIVDRAVSGCSLNASDFDEIEGIDALSVATVLKRFIRRLKEPLITFKVSEKLLALWHSRHDSQYDVEYHEAVARELQGVPAREAATLMFLLRFLVKVLHAENKNMMNLQSLSTIFALALIRKPNESELDAARDMKARASILEKLISEMQKACLAAPTSEPDAGSQPQEVAATTSIICGVTSSSKNPRGSKSMPAIA